MTKKYPISLGVAGRFGSYAKSSARLGQLVPVKYYGASVRLGYTNGSGYYLIYQK